MAQRGATLFMTIRVVLADDHRIMRDGLSALLARETEFDIVGLAEDGNGAVKLARELRPDVIVTDLAMPGLNGVEAIRRIRAEDADVRLLCLSMHSESQMVLAVLDAGASGYVVKDCCFEELTLAIRKVMANQIYLSADLVGIVVNQVRARAVPGPKVRPTQLTPREREIVQLLSEGYSTQQVADRLHVSAKTVATHRENILRKLKIEGIAALTRYALREGLSSLDAPCRVVGDERGKLISS
jgi:DNA-binding NarL/FixJ family response regulator